jgi:preprotein translocase subunit SecE
MGRDAGGFRWTRLVRYLNEVRSELARVVWPTKRELVVYTAVELGGVAVMAWLIAALDFAFTWLIVRLFAR